MEVWVVVHSPIMLRCMTQFMSARPPAALKGDDTALPGVTDADILTVLRGWLKQLVADRPAQQGERPGVEIGLCWSL